LVSCWIVDWPGNAEELGFIVTMPASRKNGGETVIDLPLRTAGVVLAERSIGELRGIGCRVSP
jgi:hypothetical protein